MVRRRLLVGSWCGAILAAWLGTARPAAAQSEVGRTEVDLALVLAVDVSFSMDPDEQTLQREGFVDAFRSTIVKDAIARGQIGRIGVVYFEWAGASDQRVVMPWTVIDTAASADAFADTLSAKPTRRASRTSISGALDFATRLLGESPFEATRRVIDVSGDGPNNSGRPVLAARADTLAQGLTVNGLPIMLKAPGYFDIADLDLYYRDCVIGGPGAFMVPARERDQFRDAVKTKIIMEIAGDAPATRLGVLMDDAPAVFKTQAPASANCLAGEIQWRDRMGN